ncbi:MAG: TetR family transcriptional regulator [Rhodobacterales bacterium]|nr:MAG: TetR family transcriptional regulator [Rhodobacterales bacterium]
MSGRRPRTRIQQRNRASILDAALEVFSQHGFRGATLDQIASAAGLSKPNMLYYYPSKEAIHRELLSGLMDIWLEPLQALKDNGDPVEALLGYIDRKLEMSRDMPRESRLFAGEVVQGAPRFGAFVAGPLKALVDEKTALIQGWIDRGKMAPVDPYHLLFSIWATTQHYADFDTQVRALLKPEGNAHFDSAREFLRKMYGGLLRPRTG